MMPAAQAGAKHRGNPGAKAVRWGWGWRRADHDRLRAAVGARDCAIVDGSRITIMRRGSEYVVIPERLRVDGGREIIVARHPSTGHRLELVIDEIDYLEVIR